MAKNQKHTTKTKTTTLAETSSESIITPVDIISTRQTPNVSTVENPLCYIVFGADCDNLDLVHNLAH